MRYRPIGRTCLLGLLSTLCCLGGLPRDAAGAPQWLRLRSPHFVVVGDAGERELRQVAERVETFRETLRRAMPRAVVATPVPTTILVFGTDAAFAPFKPLVNGKPMGRIGGFFLGGEDANYIAVSLGQGLRSNPIIFHEYTHALVSATVRFMPLWMNEGLAEVYSTFDARDNGRTVVIGLAPTHHIDELRDGRMLRLGELMAVDHDSPTYHEDSRRGMFYAQSWALVHYLLLSGPDRSGQLPAFLEQLERGVPQSEAFAQAFHMDSTVLETELRAYARQFAVSSRTLTFDESVKQTGTFAVEPISYDEAQVYTAELLARQDREAEARAQLQRVLQSSPNLPRGLAGLGRLLVRTGALDAGLPLLERAARQLPEDAAVASTYARAMVDQLRVQGPFAADNADGLARTRGALADAARLNPEDAYVVAMQGYVALVEGTQIDQAVEYLRRATAQAPAREEYQILLAQALVEQGDFGEARDLLEPLVAYGSRPDVKIAAQRMLERAEESAVAPAPGSR